MAKCIKCTELNHQDCENIPPSVLKKIYISVFNTFPLLSLFPSNSINKLMISIPQIVLKWLLILESVFKNSAQCNKSFSPTLSRTANEM